MRLVCCPCVAQARHTFLPTLRPSLLSMSTCGCTDIHQAINIFLPTLRPSLQAALAAKAGSTYLQHTSHIRGACLHSDSSGASPCLCSRKWKPPVGSAPQLTSFCTSNVFCYQLAPHHCNSDTGHKCPTLQQWCTRLAYIKSWTACELSNLLFSRDTACSICFLHQCRPAADL